MLIVRTKNADAARPSLNLRLKELRLNDDVARLIDITPLVVDQYWRQPPNPRRHRIYFDDYLPV